MSRAPDVKMSREEIDEFVAARRIAFVGRLDRNGQLSARPYSYELQGETLLLHSAELVGPGAACAVIDTYPSYDKLKGVMLRGDVAPADDGARLEIQRAGGFDFSKVSS